MLGQSALLLLLLLFVLSKSKQGNSLIKCKETNIQITIKQNKQGLSY